MDAKRKITEADGLHWEWYKEAEGMTLDRLAAFAMRIATEYEHDYGTIAHAAAASAVAAAASVGNSPQGGLTGAQSYAVCVMFCGLYGGTVVEKSRPMTAEEREKCSPKD